MAKRSDALPPGKQIALRLPAETLDTLESIREHLARLTGRPVAEVSKAEAVVWGFRQVQSVLDRQAKKVGKNSA